MCCQLKRENRRNEHEMNKLLTSNERLKMASHILFEPIYCVSQLFLSYLFIKHLHGKRFVIFFLEVLQRKTEEASEITKRMRNLLESRRTSAQRRAGLETTFSSSLLFYSTIFTCFSSFWTIRMQVPDMEILLLVR